MAGAQKETGGGEGGGGSSQRLGYASLRERGVSPRRGSVIKEGLLGTVVPFGQGTPAWWDGEASPGGGRCSRRACVG